MEKRTEMFMEKLKIVVGKTSRAASRAVDSASIATRQVAHTTKLSAKLFDVNTELEVQYRESGKLIYDMRQGVEISQDELEARFQSIDDLRQQAEELRQQIAANKAGIPCPNCGNICARDGIFCSQCGKSLTEIVKMEG